MTNIPHRYPAGQCKKLEDWPDADRQLWNAALMPGSLLEDGGARSRHSELSNLAVVMGYGRWLTWLDRQGLLDARAKPDERITPNRVRDYVTELEAVNASQTVLNRLEELRAAAQVMNAQGIGPGSTRSFRGSGRDTVQPDQNARGWLPRESCSISVSP